MIIGIGTVLNLFILLLLLKDNNWKNQMLKRVAIAIIAISSIISIDSINTMSNVWEIQKVGIEMVI